ncbi:MAG: S8 family peptidase [Cellulosilyticaceae bacterium]
MKEYEQIKNYLVDALIDYDEYSKRFPNLIFDSISSRTSILSVPPEGEGEFQTFKQEIQSIFMPTLYGLNVESGLVASNITYFHNYPYGQLRGEGILIGVIDTGIEYTNPLFQYEDQTTRIVTLWDQTIQGEGTPNFKYGTAYTEEQLNEALKAPDPYSVVPSKDEIGHGTFLAGVMAGNDRSGEEAYIGGAPEAMLAVVKLRPAKQYLREYYLIEPDAIAYQDTDYLAALKYLIDIARKLRKPMAICTSIGGNEGGHNGSSVVERYLNEVSSYEDLVFVLSAGNEANQGHHYKNTIKEGESQSFEVNVAEKETGVFINIWINRPDILTLSFSTPLGSNIDKIPIDIGNEHTFKFPLEPTRITVTYTQFDIGTGDQLITIRLATPTPGIWQFTVYGEKVVDGEYNAWLPREGFILNNTRFLKPEAFTTVCIPATSEAVIVVGAYNNADNSVYAASGRGPTRNMTIRPDLIAPGVNVTGPNLSGGYTKATGTSISAAITTSACALLLEWAVLEGNLKAINTRVAKTLLIRGATRSPTQTYPNNVTGYGMLNLKNSILEV